jgi:site-specific DNA-methyltransferase (adenine-specific)
MSDAESPKGTLELSCEDCMALMARYPDKHFDLAIVDPPYGIGMDGRKGSTAKNPAHSWKRHEKKSWDSAAPGPEYFAELRRVSKHQIIWGANYMTENLPPSRFWVFWDKGQDLTMPDGELAWGSMEKPIRRVIFNRCEAREDGIIHPTQKPVALYRWLLANYAKPGQRILDTHLGSGSHAIAAHYFGAHLTACEIDADYFAAATARIQRETAQTTFL